MATTEEYYLANAAYRIAKRWGISLGAPRLDEPETIDFLLGVEGIGFSWRDEADAVVEKEVVLAGTNGKGSIVRYKGLLYADTKKTMEKLYASDGRKCIALCWIGQDNNGEISISFPTLSSLLTDLADRSDEEYYEETSDIPLFVNVTEFNLSKLDTLYKTIDAFLE
ncbi:MAG: hypothetical protein V1743_03705 [Nanoarchaeota archaeon]